MREERLLDALGDIRDVYVMEAAPGTGGRRGRRWIAAVVIFALGMALFARTAPAAAAAAFVREQIAGWIETLFPSKEITVEVEGLPEAALYTAGGQGLQGEESAVSGFVVYYDPERYTMTEEDGVTWICPVSAEDGQETALPPCGLEIRHLADVTPETAASAAREKAWADWETVSEITDYAPLGGVMFRSDNGTAWDSPVERLYFVTDGQTGTYQLTAQYFLEAEEGHGARLAAMADTFEVVSAREEAAGR